MSLIALMLGVGSYKPRQGRLVRFVFQFVGILIALAVGLSASVFSTSDQIYLNFSAVGAILAMLLGWLSLRLGHLPFLADFLIEIQLETMRVSWVGLNELKRTTLVVLIAMLGFSVYLFTCDVVLQFCLRSISVINF